MSFLAFLDTSFLMEFKPIREISWKELLETSGDIIVTIAPIVTKELNEHKHSKDARKRDRSRRATTEIERLSQGQQIDGRPGVSFDLFGGNPSRDLLASHNLEWDAGDDQLLGSMLVARGRTSGDHSRVRRRESAPTSLQLALGQSAHQQSTSARRIRTRATPRLGNSRRAFASTRTSTPS
jgi:hypothetical protein